jgi:hypothetical protein
VQRGLVSPSRHLVPPPSATQGLSKITVPGYDFNRPCGSGPIDVSGSPTVRASSPQGVSLGPWSGHPPCPRDGMYRCLTRTSVCAIIYVSLTMALWSCKDSARPRKGAFLLSGPADYSSGASAHSVDFWDASISKLLPHRSAECWHWVDSSECCIGVEIRKLYEVRLMRFSL